MVLIIHGVHNLIWINSIWPCNGNKLLNKNGYISISIRCFVSAWMKVNLWARTVMLSFHTDMLSTVNSVYIGLNIFRLNIFNHHLKHCTLAVVQCNHVYSKHRSPYFSDTSHVTNSNFPAESCFAHNNQTLSGSKV